MKKPFLVPGIDLAKISQWVEQVPPQQRIWFLTGIIALCTGVIALQGIHAPAAAKKRALLAKVQEGAQRIDLLQKINLEEQEMKNLSEALLHQGGRAVLTQHVAQLAAQAGLTLLSAKPNPPVKAGPCERIQMEISAQGTFQTLQSFLTTLQEQKPPMEITHLEVRSASEVAQSSFGEERRTASPLPEMNREGFRQLSNEVLIETTVSGWSTPQAASS